jgi:hypothetical protein
MTDLPPRFRLVLVSYDYAKARGNQILSDARRNAGTLGEITETCRRWGGKSRPCQRRNNCGSASIVLAGDCRTYTLFGGGCGRSWRDCRIQRRQFSPRPRCGCGPRFALTPGRRIGRHGPGPVGSPATYCVVNGDGGLSRYAVVALGPGSARGGGIYKMSISRRL